MDHGHLLQAWHCFQALLQRHTGSRMVWPEQHVKCAGGFPDDGKPCPSNISLNQLANGQLHHPESYLPEGGVLYGMPCRWLLPFQWILCVYEVCTRLLLKRQWGHCFQHVSGLWGWYLLHWDGGNSMCLLFSWHIQHCDCSQFFFCVYHACYYHQLNNPCSYLHHYHICSN